MVIPQTPSTEGCALDARKRKEEWKEKKQKNGKGEKGKKIGKPIGYILDSVD